MAQQSAKRCQGAHCARRNRTCGYGVQNEPYACKPPYAKQLRNDRGGGGVTIGNDVWIGTNAIILGGVKVGQGAIIGAGAVVAKDIPSYAVVVGNPARVVKYRFSEDLIQKMLKIDFSRIDKSFLSSNMPLLYSEDMNESIDKIIKNLNSETLCIE